MHLATASESPGTRALSGSATIDSQVGSLSTTVKNACISRAADSPIVPANILIVTASPSTDLFFDIWLAFSKDRGVTKACCIFTGLNMYGFSRCDGSV